MIQLTVILTLMISVALLYLSNKQQRLFKQAINQKWRKLAWLLCALALITTLIPFQTSTAIFFTILIFMLALMAIPFVCLFQGKKK